MIRKLVEADRSAVLAYLAREPAFNVFATGDVENFGFEAPFQDLWGDFDEAGGFRAVVLRYFNNHIVYSHSGLFDRVAVLGVLPPAPGDWMLSGKEETVRPLAEALGLPPGRPTRLAELDSTQGLLPPGDGLYEWAAADTFDPVLALHASIDEFARTGDTAEGIRHNVESGTGRTVFVREGGRAIASASSAAEGSKAAMLIGVATAAEHRNRGLASQCVSRLCRALLAEGKVVCLFYGNPAAGRIYRRLGFRDVGRWLMVGAQGTQTARENGADGSGAAPAPSC